MCRGIIFSCGFLFSQGCVFREWHLGYVCSGRQCEWTKITIQEVSLNMQEFLFLKFAYSKCKATSRMF
jgi:hypothetical protein